MKKTVPYLLIFAAIMFLVSLLGFVIALAPWSLIMLGIPMLISICRSAANDR